MLAVCSVQRAVCTTIVPPQLSVSALGGGAGGWRFLILVMAIIVLLYLLSRTLDVVAKAVPSHWPMLVGLTAFQGLLVLIGFFANPLSILDSLGSSSWAAGAFLALIAAIAAVGGGPGYAGKQEAARRQPRAPACRGRIKWKWSASAASAARQVP
jgi:hypothetical protein